MITINNLNKTYHLKSGDVEEIKDVSLKIEAGEIGLPVTKNDLVLPCGIYGRWESND